MNENMQKSGDALPSLISNGLKTSDSEAKTDPEILKRAAGEMYGGMSSILL